MILKTTDVMYHRNGVAGEGFHAVLFTYRATPRGKKYIMVATVFDREGAISVLDIDKLKAGDIRPGSNRWRGDDFEPWLRATIAAADGDPFNVPP